MSVKTSLRYLADRWDERIARDLEEPELLRYRSNLLGSDLRITNFGGGNTSSKIPQADPLTGNTEQVLWVKGSGGDLGSIKTAGLATLYLDKLRALEKIYRGAAHEDEMVELYPLCSFGRSQAPPSIDTPLHGFLPFAHIDHLHPDWAIALAASANGQEKMEEFNRGFEHRLIWLPWQRPGFELALMLRRGVEENPGCDGVVLGGHGLFTWGETQRECYENTISIIDQLGQFVVEHVEKKADALFGGPGCETAPKHRDLALDILPFVRGRISSGKRMIGHYCDLPEVLRFVNSRDAERLAKLGTSCPDHFIRTKVRPLFVSGVSGSTGQELRGKIESSLQNYRRQYVEYYRAFAQPDSPGMRDPNPAVMLIPGVGMFSFGKSKTEARLTGEFYVNAIHVMEGATALGSGKRTGSVPQASAGTPPSAFNEYGNYVALPPSEAFRIEYWRLEEAKLRRQPAEKELSRHIVLVVGGGSGVGREAAMLAAELGAHVAVADRDLAAAESVAEAVKGAAGKECALALAVDISSRRAIQQCLRGLIACYGGCDIVINTAALFPSSPDGSLSDEQWAATLKVNVTGNYLLAEEAAALLREQDLEASMVFTSSANAVVPKRGSEAYDVSKAAVNHLVRELAVALAPKIRVNGISPATVIRGSAMFPRERVIASLKKYGISFEPGCSDEQLRTLLAEFYAQRTLTHCAIDPKDCAQAILFLAGPRSRCTTGHLIPVDGGLAEAFLR